jgi:general L-amino acid transport system permease protein
MTMGETQMNRMGPSQAPRTAFYNNPTVRGAFYQVLLVIVVLAIGYELAANVVENLEAQRIATGFGFLDQTAGFSVSQSLIPYNESNSYGRIFFVGLLNTLLVALLGVVLATIIGFLVGIARLSSNWLLARLAGTYVEVIRNLPLLLQILFWYLAVLQAMPRPRQSVSFFGELFFNNRGIFVPRPVFGDGSLGVLVALLVAVAVSIGLWIWARHRQKATGAQFPVFWSAIGLLVALPLIAMAMTGWPITLSAPELRGFNFVGGIRLIPELVALLIALSTYTASFIAEIVRAGIQSVPRGQIEAASALGLHRWRTMRLVVLPQALRLVIPPLTSQYLNLIKNSSLAVAIGYPDFFAVFAGTTLNQTGQAIEIIAITMAVYLAISLFTSVLMNWYNARMKLAER